MTVKEHYDTHLGNFYSWMIGDFSTKSDEQLAYFTSHAITTQGSKRAIDLGAGNGIQSIALAKLGFEVVAIDFNKQLMDELRKNASGHSIRTIDADIMEFDRFAEESVDVITCMGDTITHLPSLHEIKLLINKCNALLELSGKIVLSFRDLSKPLQDINRFIPVKSDQNRILTCFLEYFTDYVVVTDLLYEKEQGHWVQKVSSYKKQIISEAVIKDILKDSGFQIDSCESVNRMLYIVGRKIR